MGSHRVPDPLAVWTYEQAGEEIACGHPSVTDQERAVAGRETVAERQRTLLAANQRRAAARYAAATGPDATGPDGDKMDADEMVRVWYPRDVAALRSRLGGGTALAVWAEDDILHVLWRGHANQVQLSSGLQVPLWPVPGTGDLWEASLRVPRLAEAVISIHVLAQQDSELPFGRPLADETVWRGPRATAFWPAAESLAGSIEEHVLDSAVLGGPRGVTVYRPPGQRERLPVCIMADGQSVGGFAPILESAILAGAAPAVALVGVHHGVDRGAADQGAVFPDLRAREYLPGKDRSRFDAHLRFVVGEVMPWAAQWLAVPAGPWLVAGFSNGAVWSIAAAQRRPDLFTGVAVLSGGLVPRRITSTARIAGVRHYLAAGTLEPGFRRSTREWAERLQRAGLTCCYREWVGGHDHLWWAQQLPAALGWLLSRTTPRPPSG